MTGFNISIVSASDRCCSGPPAGSAESLRGLEGHAAGAGSASAHHRDGRREVSTRVPPLQPPPSFYSSITKKIGKQAVTEQHSTHHTVGEWRDGGVLSVNVTIINRYVWKMCRRPPPPPEPSTFPPNKNAFLCHSRVHGESRLFPIGAFSGCPIRIVPSSALGAG